MVCFSLNKANHVGLISHKVNQQPKNVNPVTTAALGETNRRLQAKSSEEALSFKKESNF